MQLIKQEFSDRVVEIERYFHLLESAIEKEAQIIFPNENDRREEFDFDLRGTLKSTVILLVYNLVEASVSRCLERIHQIISQELLLYNEVNDNIQKIWLEQFYDKFKEIGSNNKNVLISVKLMVDTLIQNNVPIELYYGDKEKRSSETSGNLDARQIKIIAEKYGIDFDKSNSSLRDIRDKRNKLAHGIQSFSECCESMLPSDLLNSKNEAIAFLTGFISAVEIYIDNKAYRR